MILSCDNFCFSVYLILFSFQVCLTIDHWSSHRRGFVGVTAHWLEEDVAKHACIALRRVIGKCTYDVLAELIHGIIMDYNIEGKISHCITDSGSNFVKAFEEFRLIDEINDSIEESNEEDLEEQLEPVALDSIMGEPHDEQYTLPPHFRCAVHRLNLIASDAEKALTNPVCKKVYRSLMGKVTQIFNKQTRSTLASDTIMAELGELFKIHNTTRWNSLFDALTRVKQFIDNKKTEVDNVFKHFDITPITSDECHFLTEFLEVMEPLAASLDLLQGDSVSIGYLLPALYDLLEQWKSMMTEGRHRKFTTGLVSHLIAEVKRRFDKELNSEEFMVAAAVHPSFRMHWVPADETEGFIRATRKYLSAYNQTQSDIEEG